MNGYGEPTSGILGPYKDPDPWNVNEWLGERHVAGMRALIRAKTRDEEPYKGREEWAKMVECAFSLGSRGDGGSGH
jgi:hypothetical protein